MAQELLNENQSFVLNECVELSSRYGKFAKRGQLKSCFFPSTCPLWLNMKYRKNRESSTFAKSQAIIIIFPASFRGKQNLKQKHFYTHKNITESPIWQNIIPCAWIPSLVYSNKNSIPGRHFVLRVNAFFRILCRVYQNRHWWWQKKAPFV